MEFLTYKQRYDAENTVFFESLDTDALFKSAEKLEKLRREKLADDDIKERSEALSVRLCVKRFLLLYFGNYEEAVYSEATAYLRRAEEVCTRKNYEKTLLSVRAALACFETFRPVIAEAEGWLLRVRDRSGRQITEDINVLSSVSSMLEEKIAETEKVEVPTEIFAKGVRCIDPKERVLSDLRFERDSLVSRLNKTAERENAALLDTFLRPLREEYREAIEYYPLPGDGEGGAAGALALNSPFIREAEIAVIKWAENRNKGSSLLRVAAFESLSDERIRAVSLLLQKRGDDLLVVGLSSYRDTSNKEAVATALVGLQKFGIKLYFFDDGGKNAVFEELFTLVTSGKISANDIGYSYLTLPYFRDTLAVFSEKEIATEEEFKKLAPSFSFMGYEGLNAAVCAFAQGKSWKETAVAYSLRNAEKGRKYLSCLTAQFHLLDSEWGDFSALFDERAFASEKKHVDYDDIKTRDPVNIKKILEAEIDIFKKCGAISRYCTLYGDDVSVWNDLSREEKGERMTEATRLVMRTLGVPRLPIVEVLSIAEWEKEGHSPTAGGLCCNGGTRILYKESCISNYEWTIGAICHECYHAFQHMAIDTGWREWFFTELGVTKGRIPEWEYNNRHYYSDTTSQGYRVEIMECDARAFEHDCVESSGAYWNLIDFE